MALTLNVKQRLEDKSFPQLYNSKSALWKSLYQKAVDFLDESFPDGEIIRQEDISESLAKPVSVSDDYRKHVENKKLREKRWAKDFADYIVDLNYDKTTVKRKKMGA